MNAVGFEKNSYLCGKCKTRLTSQTNEISVLHEAHKLVFITSSSRKSSIFRDFIEAQKVKNLWTVDLFRD